MRLPQLRKQVNLTRKRIFAVLLAFGTLLFNLVVGAVAVGGSVALFVLVLWPAAEPHFALAIEHSIMLRRLGIFVFQLLGYWAFARFYEGRPPEELKPTASGVVLGAASGAALISITIAILFASGHYYVESYRGFGAALEVSSFILTAAFLEEIIFRGILLRMLEHSAGTWVALIAQSLIFAVLHQFNEGASFTTLLSTILIGALWAGIFVLSRNLWLIGFHHAAWNYVIYLSGAPLTGIETWRIMAPIQTQYSGPDLLTGGKGGPEDSIITFVVVSLSLCFVIFLGRRRARFVRGPWRKGATVPS